MWKKQKDFSVCAHLPRVRRNKKTRVIAATLFEWLNECNHKKLFFNVKKISWGKRSNNNNKDRTMQTERGEESERLSNFGPGVGTSWERLHAWMCEKRRFLEDSFDDNYCYTRTSWTAWLEVKFKLIWLTLNQSVKISQFESQLPLICAANSFFLMLSSVSVSVCRLTLVLLFFFLQASFPPMSRRRQLSEGEEFTMFAWEERKYILFSVFNSFFSAFG